MIYLFIFRPLNNSYQIPTTFDLLWIYTALTGTS